MTTENSETPATTTPDTEGAGAATTAGDGSHADPGETTAASSDDHGVEAPGGSNSASREDDDDEEFDLVGECDDIAADIKSAQHRIKVSQIYEKRAGGSSKFVVATRDLIVDEVLNLMKQMSQVMGDLAEEQERMKRAIGGLAVDVATQSRTLYAITTGTSIHWANLLAQRVLASQQADPAITSLAQAVLDSMRAVHELTQTGAVREMTPQVQPPMVVPSDQAIHEPAPQTAG